MRIRSADTQFGKNTGLTLIQTMLLVMVLGLLLTWAVSFWLERPETEAPGTPNSSAGGLPPEERPR